MVRTKERVRFFNRNSRRAYISWLKSKIDFKDEEVESLKTRSQIDAVIFPPKQEEAPITEEEEEPSWVQAGKEAISPKETQAPIEVEEIEDSPFSKDYDSYTIRELQELCKYRGLTIRGTKAQVVLRLRRDDEGISEAQPEEDETKAPSKEAAEESSDAPSKEAATEEVTNNDSSRQKQDIDEEE